MAAIENMTARQPERAAHSRGAVARLPLPLLAFALAMTLLHFAPYWRAGSQMPSGWTFTGNLHSSPDFMQYRTWFRQSQRTGVLVSSNFTSEPNPPHLPVALYYATGKLASWTRMTPEYVYIYIGGAFLLAFSFLLFATIRLFLPHPYQTWWVYLVIFLGGGLGGYLKLLGRFDLVKSNFFLQTLIIDPMVRTAVFEDFRGHYIVNTLWDTHHLMTWLITTLTLVAVYLALQKASTVRLAAAAVLCFLTPLLHVYEGVTLLAILGIARLPPQGIA